ncbi:MAG: bile acid:sodium symporter family protein [Candidatus Desulfofervidaceae bacterium]|nr:bile acid:sodium symporter family protein [Candidatus Desulfofervidaceae bacterium]
MNWISNLLWFWTLLITPVAIFFPDVFIPFRALIKPLLGSVILAMGLTLKFEDFKPILLQPKKVLVGILSQYTVMPLSGLLIGLLLFYNLPKDFIAGQILTGSCPTGVVSNVYNFLAQASVALSISLSAINTVIAPFLTPYITAVLAGKIIHVDINKLFIDMIQVTLLPVCLGIIINSFFEKRLQKIKSFLPIYSTLTVVFIIGFVVASGHEKILTLGYKALFLLFLASFFHLFFGYILGYMIAKLFNFEEKYAVTVSIETAMQNSGLATVLALSQWGGGAAFPAITYSVVQNIFGPFVCNMFRNRIFLRPPDL